MSNPVFDRIDKTVGQYAGFGRGPQGSPYGGPGRAQAGPSTYQQPYGAPEYGRMSDAQLRDMYDAPAAGPVQMGRLTVDDVVMKFAGLFTLVLVGAGITGLVLPRSTSAALIIPAIVVTLVLGLVIAFKKSISVPLIVAYSAFEGVLVGAVSAVYANAFGRGVVTTAIFATLSVFVGMFAAWKSGLIRVNDKFRRFMVMAVAGYAIFALANFVGAMFGLNGGWGFFGFASPMSILVSLFAVGLASFSLVMDFDSIDNAVAAGAPRQWAWLLAHGLIVTVVWLYLEILRLVAQFTSLSRD